MIINKDTQVCMSISGNPSNFGTTFHNCLYQQLGLNYLYKAFSTNNIGDAVKGIRALGIRGSAISMPHKEACIPFIDELTDSVKAINAVNTIVNTNGILKAYNTDYIAIRKLINEYSLSKQQSVVVHGSGGMAKAVVAAFCDEGFSDVTILARNKESGSALAKKYGFTAITKMEKTYDVLVNATSVGMANTLEANNLSFPQEAIAQASIIFEVVASPINTPLIQEAKRLHKTIITGREVMVLQAVEQFVLYTGKQPTQEQITKAIEKASQSQS